VYPEVAYRDVSAALGGWFTFVYKGHARHVVLIYCCWRLRVSLCYEYVPHMDELVGGI